MLQLRKLLHIVKLVYTTYVAYKASLLMRRRRWWVRPVNLSRQKLGFFQTCFKQLESMDEEHFYKASRMSVPRFNLLLALLKESLQKHSRRKPIDPETRLSITILYLAQGCSFQLLAWMYKVGVSTAREIVYETCAAMWNELHEVYMPSPNIYDWKNIAQNYYSKTGMPHCLGAIDGKHVNIVCPKDSGSLYFNYKKTFSVILLAACDANFNFTFVDVGAIGSQSDSGVFYRSGFGKKILDYSLEVPADECLPLSETLFPFYFVGDNAFPLKKNLMRPFPGKNLSSEKRQFNETLSRARVSIEIAFGILANRWRVLHTTISASPKNVDTIILATVVLHNFLMIQKDVNYYNSDLLELIINSNESFLPNMIHQSANRSSQEAFLLRNILKDYLTQSVNV